MPRRAFGERRQPGAHVLATSREPKPVDDAAGLGRSCDAGFDEEQSGRFEACQPLGFVCLIRPAKDTDVHVRRSSPILLLEHVRGVWTLDSVVTSFAGADADDGVEVADPDLAVADLAGLTGSDDGLGDLVGVSVVDDDVDTQFGEELDFVFGASVDLGVAPLAAVPAYFSDGHALDPGVTHGFGNVIEFVRLDDGHDCSHGFLRSRAASRNARGSRGGGGGPNPAAPRV